MAFLFMLRSFLCRSLTRSTTPHGIALLGGTLAAMWHTRRSISSTSTWAKWPFYCSSQAEIQTHPPKTTFNSALILSAPLYICYHRSADMLSSWFPVCFSLFATCNTTTGGWLFSHAWTGDVRENANVKPLLLPAHTQRLHIWQTHCDS